MYIYSKISKLYDILISHWNGEIDKYEIYA